MIRELTINEMNAVCGGEDEVIATGTITSGGAVTTGGYDTTRGDQYLYVNNEQQRVPISGGGSASEPTNDIAQDDACAAATQAYHNTIGIYALSAAQAQASGGLSSGNVFSDIMYMFRMQRDIDAAEAARDAACGG